MWIVINRFLLISSIAVYILISIPYLFIDIFEVPIFNVILSNVYALLICVSAILYEYTIAKEYINSRKDLTMKKEGNL
jgi:preprotein translocase subunit SecY